MIQAPDNPQEFTPDSELGVESAVVRRPLNLKSGPGLAQGSHDQDSENTVRRVRNRAEGRLSAQALKALDHRRRSVLTARSQFPPAFCRTRSQFVFAGLRGSVIDHEDFC